MDDVDLLTLLAAIDEWVADYHKVEGFRYWRDDIQAAKRQENMVYPHAGWDAEHFCTSPEGEQALRLIFGERRSEGVIDPSIWRDVAPESPEGQMTDLEQARQLAAHLWGLVPAESRLGVAQAMHWVPDWLPTDEFD